MLQDSEYLTYGPVGVFSILQSKYCTALSSRYGLTYPLHLIPLLRSTYLVILNNNTMLMDFVVTNVIMDSIFSPIVPIGAMEDIMVAIMVEHPVIIPILLPTQIKVRI